MFLQIREILMMTTSKFLANTENLTSEPSLAEAPSRLVWDLPVRVGHWALAGCFLGAWLTSDSEYFAVLHLLFGYSILAILLFRLSWGFIGSRYARWGSFIFSRGETWSYLKGMVTASGRDYPGHNPLGSIGIFLMLGLLSLMIGSGLALDFLSPTHWVSEIHEMLAELMLILISVHVLGVLFSGWLHHQRLIPAMIHGRKANVSDGLQIPHSYSSGLVLLLTFLGLSVYYVLSR
jgi:cytochrome b